MNIYLVSLTVSSEINVRASDREKHGINVCVVLSILSSLINLFTCMTK